jgi:hypothetical protein
MQDRFFAALERYMLPMEKFERVVDSSYFLRKNLSFAFAQGYCHPPGGFYGKLINYPDPGGALDIFGRRYTNTTKKRVDGRLELLPIDRQLALHYLAEPALRDREGIPPFGDYHVRFSLDDCVGFFEHGHSLRAAMGLHPWLAPKVEKLSDFLGLPADRLGATGSLAYGRMDDEHEDIDLAIRAGVEEHRAIVKKIDRWLGDPSHRVFEFGRHWPLRFYFEGTLICPFFIYGRPAEIPLADFRMEVVREGVSFRGRVSDDTHAIFLPIVARLDDVSLDGAGGAAGLRLVVYDSSARGEYREGDILSGVARLVAIRTRAEEYRALLVTNADAIAKARPGAGTEAKA